MNDLSQRDYPAFDKPEITRLLFFPRVEMAGPPDGSERLKIRVEEGVALGGRLYTSRKEDPTILFFHGNGEIVADYSDIGALYQAIGVNFLPVDYRGYGLSSGTSTVTTMMRDSHAIFAYVATWLGVRKFTGPLVVMGRSLGSAPAVEIASNHAERVTGLIIESGFARILPLLGLLGIDDLELTEDSGTRNLEKIGQVRKPTLIIHAEYDHIIPFSEGKDLYEASGAREKTLIKIPDADHNTIFSQGMKPYLDAIGMFREVISQQRY